MLDSFPMLSINFDSMNYTNYKVHQRHMRIVFANQNGSHAFLYIRRPVVLGGSLSESSTDISVGLLNGTYHIFDVTQSFITDTSRLTNG
jgi:hypothetical protein